TYIDTLNLPFRTGGYQLAYQRCCRNQTIVNIVAPLATGATYYNYISEEALLGCNSSAVFNQWPPNYICVDEPIRFDHSATDIDGDSIVYRMCTPFLGANQDTPRPQPPFNPPYDSITWIDPPYNVANMMGGVPLEIDPNTGLLTGTPNTIGQFVVGVCVEEYRDGILISTTKRDFQYNTGICGEAISSFFAPEVDCDGFSVDFTNQSDNATEFYWNFGDPNTTSDVSILSNPSYVYPDTGLYEIMLIADPNDLCSDTTYTTVSVQYPSLFVDFDMEIIDGCIFPAEIIFTDITYDTISTPVEWEWLFSDGTVSNEQNPVWIITDGGNYTATLTVTSENGCQFSTVEALTVEVLNLNLTDTTVICQGEEVQLNVNSDLLYTYTWTPDSNIDDVNIPSPTV
ncbi:MAG: PKD domain-containing protein, partial [Saprospiraceae bacterium]